MLRRGHSGVRGLRAGDADAALAIALRDPARNALAGARLTEMRRSLHLSGEFLGLYRRGRLEAVCWTGANLCPIGADADALAAFAAHVGSQPRRSSSIVGARTDIAALWPLLGPAWDGVRDFRWSQPLLDQTDPPTIEPLPGVRPARPDELDAVFPAGVAMFVEEVGSDPTRYDGGRGFRSRFRTLIGAGRTYVLTDVAGEVVFKADVGAVFGPVAQIHGVWTRPADRAHGIGRRGMAAVAEQVRRDHADRVTLYVNDFNRSARAAYAAAGFRQIDELSTLLY